MKVTINSNNLKQIISESIRKVIAEGSPDQSLYNAWLECQELLGAEGMLDELYNALSEDEIRENLEWIDRCHDLGLFDDEEEEYDEDEYDDEEEY